MSDAAARIERWVVLLTPAAALAVVALGLRVGAPSAIRAAVVYGAPPARAQTALAWQVAVFEEDRGMRQSVSAAALEVTARRRGTIARWMGVTNDDGVAEALLGLSGADGVSLDLWAAGSRLAQGEASAPTSVARLPPASPWLRFARREGPIVLDVAVLGQRVASGFPASLWVRASEAATRLPVTGASIEAERDSSLSVSSANAETDSRGWASLVATPMGHSVALTLHARDAAGRTGEWVGALFVSPGGAQLVARDRYAPDEEPTLDIVVPNERSTLYVEVDDAQGRAWAGAFEMTRAASQGDRWPSARAHVPRLAPGLYWAVSSGDPAGASQLGPGTMTRPFVVAATDEAGLAFGTDAEECIPRRDPGETARALPVCLALAAAPPVPRWTALDGFSTQRAHDATARANGLGLSLGAVAIAMALEALLLVRAARRTRARMALESAAGDGGLERMGQRTSTVALAILVALLGFSLLAAFLVRER